MTDISAIKSNIEKSSNIIILTVSNPNFDVVAASLSLYLSLKKAGKSVQIASSTEPIVRDSHLVGLDKIKTDIGNANLVISFPYKEELVEKVTYAVDDDTFNLVIQPKEGHDPVKKEDLKFSYTGTNADTVFIMGASSIKSVGSILDKEKDLLDKAIVINITNRNASFGKLNLIDTAASVSEIVTALLQEINIPLTKDAAQNLMLGIEHATNNLQSTSMTADTFEALAVLYRAGARRSGNTFKPTQEQKETVAKLAKMVKSNKRKSQAKSTSSQQSDEQTLPQLQDDENPKYIPVSSTEKTGSDNMAPQPDWLKPKIFKSSSIPKI